MEQNLPLTVSQNKLRRVLLRSNLLAKANTLQGFAYATSDRNRLIGRPGHTATVNWLADTLKATGYYDVTVEPFVTSDPNSSTLSVDGKTYRSKAMTGSPEGNPVAPLVAVANLGCDAVS